jgi:hypothetical protein
MAQGTISQRIALEGDQEIKARLSELGATGEASVRRIGDAARSTGGHVGDLGDKFGSLRGSAAGLTTELGPLIQNLTRMGSGFESNGAAVLELVSGIGGLAAAISGAAGAFLLLSKNAAEATRSIENQAHAVGMEVEQFEGLRFAFTQAGVSSESFVRGIDRFAARLGEAADAQKKLNDSFHESQQKADQTRLEIDRLRLGVDTAAQAIGKSETATREASEALAASQNNIDKAKLSYDRLKGAIDPLGESMALSKEQHLRLSEASVAASNSVSHQKDLQDKLAQSLNEVTDAHRRYTLAQEELRIKQGAVAKVVDDTKNVFLRLKIDALDPTTGAARDVGPAFLEFVDKFKEIKAPAEQAEVAMRLFGRQFRDLLPGLNLGRDRLEELSKTFRELGVSSTAAETELAVTFNAAFAKLDAVVEGLQRAVGNLVGQVFTPLFDAISEGLSHNSQNIRDFAEAFSQGVRPAVTAAITAVGVAFHALGLIVDGLRRVINATFGSEFTNGAVAVMLLLARFAPLIGSVILAAEVLRKTINAVFGTEFTTGGTLAVLLLLRFAPVLVSLATGFLGLGSAVRLLNTAFTAMLAIARVITFVVFLSSSVGTLSTAFTALTTAVGVARTAMLTFELVAAPILAVVLVIGLVVAALVTLAANAQRVSDLIRKYIGDDAADAFDKFAAYIQEVIAEAVNYVMGLFGKMAGWFADKIGDMMAWVDKLIDKLNTLGGLVPGGLFGSSAAGHEAGGTIQAFSGGGRPRGPGTDTVLGWLTPGEFVHKVAAVQHYGVEFMHRINNLEIPRFNIGGLISAVAPPVSPMRGFSAGAAATASRTSIVNLSIDGHMFEGLVAPESVAQGLVSYSRTRQVRSAGRRPGWKSA